MSVDKEREEDIVGLFEARELKETFTLCHEEHCSALLLLEIRKTFWMLMTPNCPTWAQPIEKLTSLLDSGNSAVPPKHLILLCSVCYFCTLLSSPWLGPSLWISDLLIGNSVTSPQCCLPRPWTWSGLWVASLLMRLGMTLYASCTFS